MKKNIIVTILFVAIFILIQFGFWRVEKAVEKYNNTQVEINIKDGVSSHENINITMVRAFINRSP